MPAITLNNAAAGGNVLVTYVGIQNNYNLTICQDPAGQATVVDPALINAIANHVDKVLANSSDGAASLRDELRTRLDRWENDIKLLRDNLDREALRRESFDLQTWLERNGRQLLREERARGWALLARIELFFEDNAGEEADE